MLFATKNNMTVYYKILAATPTSLSLTAFVAPTNCLTTYISVLHRSYPASANEPKVRLRTPAHLAKLTL
jgi:hypothetical protein